MTNRTPLTCLNQFSVPLLCLALLAVAPVACQGETWEGYEKINFQVAGRQAFLIAPKTPAASKPWIWRTEFFGHEPQADKALLAKGFHVGYINVQNLYGGPQAMEAMDAMYA
ncbi:MAG: hypothetical protein IT423_02260, partial [Pirellulaceae bacterium]|nr:hypothetical protein [Pirellulaceae bacterium]